MQPNDCKDRNWELLRQGDRQAMLMLFDEHYPGLLNYGLRLTYDRELVRDTITDLLIRLWDKHDRLPVVENTRSYLITCLHRQLIVHKYANSKWQKCYTQMIAEQHEELSYEEYIVKVQTSANASQKLRKALKRLTSRERELLQLRFFDDLDYETIAERCGISKRTAYNLIYAALQRIRKELGAFSREETIISAFLCLMCFIIVDMARQML